MNVATTDPTQWLTKKYIDEYSLQFRTVWQLT